MGNITLLATIATGIIGILQLISDRIYLYANSISGKSWFVDNLIALPLDNHLIKAAVVGACFMAAWYGTADKAETARRRRILLATLVACVFVIATTKTLSKTVFLPRPFIQSQTAYHLEGDQLVESKRLPYHVPQDEENKKAWENLQHGEVIQNDLGSFPSDHAGFYVTLAVGILLASRVFGLIAISWTVLIALSARIITGQHSPLDIVTGSVIGIAILLVVQFFASRWFRRLFDPVVNWTFEHSAVATAIMFVISFEATNTLENVRPLLKFGASVAKHIIRG